MSLINPSWLLPAIPVLVGSLTLMGLFVKHHQVTGKWMARCWSTAWKKLFTKAAFFWFVNLVFMAVSVLHAGLFFALLEPANAFFGLAPLLGFAVAMTLDLASIVFMQARLSALRMNEKRSAGWYLCSIMACSGLSAFGNLAMSLEDFQPESLNHAGSLIQHVAPWLGVAFPLLIILISIAADKVLDIDPTEHLDVETYRKLEQKRIAILVERNNFLEQQVEQDRRRNAIKQQAKDSKRRKREPAPEEQSPASTELEHLMSQLQTVQEQVRELCVAVPARVSEQQEPCISPPLPETTPRDPRAGTAPSQIAALVRQQYGLRGVTPGLVSQVFTRLVPSAHLGDLNSSPVDTRVNTRADVFADSTRSVEMTANGHHAQTIPITPWRAEVVESEQETGHIREAEQTSTRRHTDHEIRPIAGEYLTIQRTAVASDGEQNTDQPRSVRVNSKTFPNQTAQEPWRGVEVEAIPPVNEHFPGQESDHSVNHSVDTPVNSTATTGADGKEDTVRTLSEPSGAQHSEYPGEQEKHDKETLEVNSTANARVNTRANRPAKTPRRSSKGMAFADKQRGEASQRVRRVLKKYPTASLSQLAEKAKVSRGYASQVRAQVLAEQHRQPEAGA